MPPQEGDLSVPLLLQGMREGVVGLEGQVGLLILTLPQWVSWAGEEVGEGEEEAEEVACLQREEY